MRAITEPVLMDIGPLVALLRNRDSRHELCREQADRISGAVFTTWPVITEAAWLLRHESDGLVNLLRALDDEGIRCLHLESASVDWLAKYAQRYRDISPQLADLSILYLADRLRIEHIFTLDRRDFLVYRRTNGDPFILLPESLST